MTRTPTSICRRCGKTLDGAFNPRLTAPKPGDASICMGCSLVAIFDEDLQLREPTTEEFVEIMTNPEMRYLTDLLEKLR